MLLDLTVKIVCKILIAFLFEKQVKPGVKFREIGNVIQKHVTENSSYSVVRSYCGHGIHRLFHTAPNIPHYASQTLLPLLW